MMRRRLDWTGVTPSPAKTWPLTDPVISGSGSSWLDPSAGTAKFSTAAISATLIPATASGGSCTSRSAESRAAARLACRTPKCISTTVPPAGTVTFCHSYMS